MIFKTKSNQLKELEKKVAALEEKLVFATKCMEKISNGSFDIDVKSHWTHGDENAAFIATAQRMSRKMKEYFTQEKDRQWIAEGISKFMELTRSNHSNIEDFYDRILSQLVRYLGLNQGGLFLLNDDNPSDLFLELTSVYAYGRKRFLQKRVDIDQGLLGQCYLEKETIRVTQVPRTYVTITSGLGEATAKFLLLVPMKHNGSVLGVIELASFQTIEPFQIEFIERIAEHIAAMIFNMHSARRVEQLFNESQSKAEKLQAQEEELHKSVQELVRAQEEMKRNQKELDQQTALLKFIIDNIPFPVFVKDDKGRYVLVNKAEAKLFNQPEQEIIGKDDSHFVKSHEEWRVIQESDALVMASELPFELPLQHFTTNQGAAYVFKTTKVPFVNFVTGRKNILGVSIDLTEKIDLEKKLFHEQSISGNNLMINIVGRQRMLTQKIGFYAETLVRGKMNNTSVLCDAIELFEHSLQIIRYGGMPMGVISERPLQSCEVELLPYLEKIESLWASYRKSVERILYCKPENILNDEHSIARNEESIHFIEENGEILLKLNNDLMLAYIALNQNTYQLSVIH